MERCEEVIVALRRIIRAVDLHSKQLIQRSGLSGPQLLLMQAIKREGAVSPGKLAKLASLSQATVTAIIDRLEERGVLTRSRSSKDKRAVSISLSEAGEKALASAPPLLQDHFIRRFRKLEEWEQTQILASLQRLAHMMDASDLDAAPYLETRPLGAGPQPEEP